ncbi:recombination mediator RecR [Hyphomicrobium facile]|uniref:Recombination protein RecR n=1 Tax=Hyphomicrobium facile TaxID=51670 RepID=A0A1I7MVL0_9HYPH|nr:recombination mediator RecR [Hyphomicrobium facile]SFV26431.1 DNA replication and repair protein RecR [Hyphomicrobium facile]
MSRKTAGPEIERLVQLLARLPGLGPRSSRKAVLSMLKRRNELLVPLSEALQQAIAKIAECPVCGNLDTVSPCSICADPRRDQSLIVVVEEVGDLWALERAGVVSAQYHVLGGHLSPLDGVGPDKLNIASLVGRARSPDVKEILLALNATVEGQSTAHFISDQLVSADVTVSRLAQGVPIGGELDYLDDGTLAAAFKARRKL